MKKYSLKNYFLPHNYSPIIKALAMLAILTFQNAYPTESIMSNTPSIIEEVVAYVEELLSNPISVGDKKKQCPIEQSTSGSFKKEEGSSEPPAPKHNIFEIINPIIQAHCFAMTNFPISTSTAKPCLNFLKDFNEIATPYCPLTHEVQKIAAGCRLNFEYYLRELTGKNSEKIKAALIKLHQNLNSYDGPTPVNLYSIVLNSVNGDKGLAIFLMGLEYPGFNGGIGSLISKLSENKPKSSTKSPNDDMISALSLFKGSGLKGALPEKYQESEINPYPEGIDNIRKGKGYHFWGRALITYQLKQRGYPDQIARMGSDYSQLLYEYGLDFIEHVYDAYERGDLSFEKISRLLEDAGRDYQIANEASNFALE